MKCPDNFRAFFLSVNKYLVLSSKSIYKIMHKNPKNVLAGVGSHPKTYENEAVNAMQDMAEATETAAKNHKDFKEATERVGNKWYNSHQHPLHGVLKRFVKIKMPDGSIKTMKVKDAYRKGFLKTQ